MPNLIVSPNVDTLLSAADNAAIRTNIELGTTSSPTFANLALTSPSLASDAPVTISQTWGTTGTYTAFKVVATETLGANGNSNLLELWSGSTPTMKARVDKLGAIYGQSIIANGTFAITNSSGYYSGYLNGLYADHNAIIANQGAYIGFSAVNNSASSGADVKLVRDGAANTLALRNGATAQTFNVYGTSGTNNTDYRRLSLACPTNGEATIQSQFSTPVTVTGMGSTASTATIFFTTPAAFPTGFPVGSTVAITGISPAGYNGTYTVTASNATSVTYANNTNAPYTGGGTAVVSGFTGTVSINGVPIWRGKGNLTENIGIGTNTLASITTGVGNIAIGANALQNNTAQGNSVAIGLNAQQNGGSQSIAIGSLTSMVAANQSVAVGYAALSTASHGDAIGIGWASLYSTQANNVVALGTNSGRYIANGSTANSVATTSLFIGGLTKALDTAQSNQIVIGYDATGIGSDSVVLGNDSITKTALKGNVGIGTTNPTSNLTVAQSTAGIGTVSIPVGNNAVTGVGTQFLDTFRPGDSITISGQTFSIASISSNTALVATPGAAATYTNQPYTTVGGTRFNVAGNGDVFVRHPLIPKLRIVADVGSSNLSGLTLEAGTSTFAGFLFNPSSGETRLGAFATGGYFQTFYTENAERMRILANGNVGIGTTSPMTKLHVEGDSSPTLTVKNTSVTGYSQVLLANTVVPGSGFWVNGSAQVNYGGASSFNIYAAASNIAFHTASVTNALSIAQSGVATFSQVAIFGNDINGQRDVYCASNRYLRIGSSMGISSSASGVLTFAALNPPEGIARLTFGGIDATFPALKRSGTSASFDVVLANDSGFTSIQDLYRRFGAGSPEGVVTAPTGAVYHNTSGGSTTTFYVKESSPTPNTGWVGK